MKDSDILYYKKDTVPNKQAETVNMILEKALRELKLNFKSLSYVAVTVGPGRFTGLRVGISIANALRFTLNIPLIDISNFEAIAHNYKDREIGIILEAGVNKYYFQSFNNAKKTSEITVINKDEAKKLNNLLFLVGNVDIVNEKVILDAKHVAKFVDHKSKDPINFKYDYLKPQYVISNYMN